MSKERLGDFIQEYSVKNKKNLGYPVYSVTNSNGFCTEYFSKDVSGEDKTTYKIVPYGYFAYNPSRINVGSVDWQQYEDNVIVSPLYVVFKCLEGLDQTYLKYFLKSSAGLRKINASVSGSVRNNLKFNVFSEFELNIGTLEEQRRIVADLDKIKAAIDLAQHQIDLYDELIKARFVEMFAKYENTSHLVLDDISEMVTVGIANSATHAYSKEGVIMFRNQNIKEGFLDDSDLIYIREDFANKYKTKALKGNDLLVTRTGYPGIACIVPEKYEGCQTFTTLIVRLKNDANIRPVFVCHYINSSYGKKFVTGNQVGVAQQNFGAKSLAQMPIFLPPVEEQIDFENLIELVDKSKVVAQKEIDLYTELLNKMMDKYFNGEAS